MKALNAAGSLRLAGLVLSLAAAAGCGKSVANFGIDDPSVEAETQLTSSTNKTCLAPQVRPTYALGGTILAPWGAMQGYVLVKDESIVGLASSLDVVPAGVPVVETGGVIAPGLVDLHNHVAYDFIQPWTPPQLYQNRYQWQDSSAYSAAVKAPYNKVKNAGHLCQAQKWGELRALTGGTTTIQGSIGYTCQNGWVRNVESYMFCEDHVRQTVMPVSTLDQLDADSIIAQMNSGTTQAYLVHLAEGVDDSSRGELDYIKSLGLLRKELVLIHGTALTPAQWDEVGRAGAKLIWSPKSNLALYGQTTDIASAMKAGVKVALAPDWTPSGSSNLLQELKVADQVLKTQAPGLVSDQQLVEMVTSAPAEIVGMGDKVGRIAPGFAADLVVVRPASVQQQQTASYAAPYRSFIDARPEDVVLTVVAGKPLYGETQALDALGITGYETLNACGQTRGILVPDATVTNGGTETLASLQGTFASDAVTPYPLIACNAN